MLLQSFCLSYTSTSLLHFDFKISFFFCPVLACKSCYSVLSLLMSNSFNRMKLLYKHFIFGLFCLLFCGTALHSQVTLKGKVRDAKTGDDLIGASVVEVNAEGGALTNFDGEFSLKVSALPATIRFSYTGYASMELEVSDENQKIIVSMSTDNILDEVVVVGQRVGDKQKAAPLTVENLDAIAIKQTASVNF